MKFIVTKELGKLARWLRIAGFDTVYYTLGDTGTLIIRALREDRVIITKSTKKIDALEKKTLVVTYDNIEDQLKTVFKKLNLKVEEEKMFTRCTVCNEPLVESKKQDVEKLVPERVYYKQELFKKCFACNKIYWQGSHWENVKRVVSNQLSATSQ